MSPTSAAKRSVTGNSEIGMMLLRILPQVLDDLAVVRKAAGRDELDLAAQLGDVADRCDDRLGESAGTLARLALQRHAVVAGLALDDEARLQHLGVAAHDLVHLLGRDEE